VAQVEITRVAVEDLDRLIATLSLPADTRQRVQSCLTPLSVHPLLGPALAGRWQPLRVLLGPWRWMLLLYEDDQQADRVVIVTVQDARRPVESTAS